MELVVNEVIEGICHIATVATLIVTIRIIITVGYSIAIYELLFREGLELSVFDKVGTLEGTNCGEGPACSAM